MLHNHIVYAHTHTHTVYSVGIYADSLHIHVQECQLVYAMNVTTCGGVATQYIYGGHGTCTQVTSTMIIITHN